MPLAVRFFLAFLIVLGLIGATAWAVRRFGAGRLGANAARPSAASGRDRSCQRRRPPPPHPGPARQCRTSVDDRRADRCRRRSRISCARSRRPREVAVGAPDRRARSAAARHPAAGKRHERLMAVATGTDRPRVLRRGSIICRKNCRRGRPPPSAEPPPRPQRDTLSALAEELTTRPLTPAPRATSRRGRSRPSFGWRASRATPRPQPQEPRSDPRQEPPRTGFRTERRAEPRTSEHAETARVRNSNCDRAEARSARPPARLAGSRRRTDRRSKPRRHGAAPRSRAAQAGPPKRARAAATPGRRAPAAAPRAPRPSERKTARRSQRAQAKPGQGAL